MNRNGQQVAANQNLLITGVSGLLGGNLARHFLKHYNVLGTYHNNRPSLPGVKIIQADLSTGVVADLARLDEFSPDLIIHCAGEANVDSCEESADHADRNIFQVTKSVSLLARRHGAHMVSISTDAVGDGSVEYMKEEDCTNPINVYGQTKVRAEEYLLAEHSSSMVVRTRFYGINVTKKMCFTERLVNELKRGNEVACFVDNYCSQIYVTNLADVLEHAMAEELSGIYNIVEDKKFSRFEHARLTARIFGLDEDLIVPSFLSDADFLAPRPRDTSLSNAKIKEHTESEILPAEKGLEAMCRDMKKWH